MQRGPGTFNVAASNKYRTVSPSQRQAMVEEAVSSSKVLTAQDIRKQGKHIFGRIEKFVSMYIFKFRHEAIPIETLKKKKPSSRKHNGPVPPTTIFNSNTEVLCQFYFTVFRIARTWVRWLCMGIL